MQIRVLGPIDVVGAQGVVDVGGPRQRRLLAALAAHPNAVVSTERLVEIVWEDDPPDTARRVFRTYVNRLRRALEEAEDGLDGNAVILTRSPGYLLVVGDEQLDVLRAEQLVAEARRRRSVDPDVSSRLLTDALALWRGPPFGEFAHEEWAAPGAARLGELELVAAEEWCAVHLELEDPKEVVPDLQRWIGDHPLREGFRELEMVALNQVGRQADALRAFQEHREILAESGLEPGQRLVELERAIATRDPSLATRAAGRRVRDYRLVAKIGAGAFGEVYRGNQPSLDRMVAVKVIRPELADDPEFVRRFEAEAHLVAQLEHPRIVPLYDYWREPGAAYLVMRWLRGGTVADQLPNGPFSEEAASRLIDHLGDALRAAHRAGVVHGDVKPANVLVDDEGGFYLGDFGLAGLVDSESGPLDFSADIAGLARTMHAVLDGNTDFLSDRVTGVLERPGRFDSIDELVIAYQAAVADTELLPPSKPGPFLANPYVGLRPFGEGDASMFFGREDLVGRLLARVSKSRWTTVVGPSGSGKSSVVRAGLLPALRSGRIPGSDRWFLTTMIPGPKPFEELETALLRVAVNPPASLLSQLTEDDRGIARAVSRVLPDRDGELTLVLDQFEELFTLAADDERERFLTALAVAVSDERSQLRVISTLRADFYDRPLRSRAIAALLRDGTEVITPMTGAEVEAAIVRPAEARGAAFEGALTGRIAADVTDQPAALPLLQYALSEVFERNRSGLLTAEAYDELGGVQGALTTQADAVLASLGPTGREAARRLFARLVTLGEGVEDTRRRVRLVDLPADEAAHDAIEAFANARLLTYDRDPASRTPTVEVAHEALIREWPTLRSWLDDDRDGLRLLRHLGDSASAWNSTGRDDSELYRGARLSAASDWAATHPDQLTPAETDFVDASQAAAEAERHTEERRIRRLRRLVGAVGAALVIALIAGGVALTQQGRANEQADRAEAQAAFANEQTQVAEAQTELAEQRVQEAELAALILQSNTVAADDGELSILLALEAHRRTPGPESEQAVLRALTSSRTLTNPVSSFSFRDVGDQACPDGVIQLSAGGETLSYVERGQLVSRETLTGVESDHGPPPAPCVNWIGDQGLDRRLVYSSEGKIWLGSYDGSWDVERDFGNPTEPAFLSGFNAAHRLLFVSIQQDGPVAVIVNDTTGQTVGAPITGPEDLTLAGMSPDGAFIAVGFAGEAGQDSGVTVVLEGETGTEVFRSTGFVPVAFAFDTAAKELVVGTADRSLVTMDLGTGDVLSTFRTSATSNLKDVGVRQDGSVVVSSSNQVEIFDRRTGATGERFEISERSSITLRADDKLFTTDADSQLLEVYELALTQIAGRTIDLAAQSSAVFHDGYVAVTDLQTSNVQSIDLATGDRVEVLLNTPAGVTFEPVFVLPDQSGFLAVSADAQIARWEDGVMIERISPSGDRAMTPVGFSFRDGTLGVMSRMDDSNDVAGESWLINANPGELELLTTSGELRTLAAAVSSEGGLDVLLLNGLMSTHDRTGTRTNLVATGLFFDGRNPVTSAFSEELVAFGGPGGAAVIEPAAQHARTLPSIQEAVTGLAFARDGAVLVAGSSDGTVRTWDIESNTSTGVIWRGTDKITIGTYDKETDSVWIAEPSRLVNLPLNPAVVVAQACDIVSRDLTEEEWNLYVPDDGPVQSSC